MSQADLNDIALFAEVVAAGSFTAAGNALGIPLSTVSRRISRLENSLGLRLLQRTTRRLSLTDAGRVYFDSVAPGLAALDAAERALAERQGEPRGKVRVSAPADMLHLATITAAFLAEHPHVEVELSFENRIVDLVAEGFDLAVRAGPLADSSLIVRSIGQMANVIVAAPSYLEQRGTPERLADLREHDCVVYGTWVAAPTWPLAEDGDSSRSVTVRARLFVNHIEAVREAAVAGVGLALLPVGVCMQELCSGELVNVLREVRAPIGKIALVYPSRRHLAPAVRAYVEYVKSALDERIDQLLAPCDGGDCVGQA